MPYYVVKGLPVFLYPGRRNALHDLALADANPEDLVLSYVAGSRGAKNADKLCHQWLSGQHAADPEAFRAEWVEFDLDECDAGPYAWDLLFDSCDLHGRGQLVDVRVDPEFARILDDWSGEGFTYPMGRTFALEIPSRLSRWRPWRSSSCTRILIDTSQIMRATGTLSRFTLVGRQITLVCDHDVHVVPTDAHATA